MIKHRRLLLCGIGSLGLVLNVAIFFPGYMSTDSIEQLNQMLGLHPLTDMQPLAMVAVWRLLFGITGHISTLLILQLAMLWSALTLLAIYIYQETKSLKIALSPFIIGILPFVLNISGVIWKDNQMAFALLLAAVGCLYFKYIPNRIYKGCLLGVVLLLMIYACLVRYNAFPAIIPLLFLAIRQSGFVRKIRWQIVITICLCVFTALLFSLMSVIMQARQNHPDVFVMVDDIANVASSGDIKNARIQESSKRVLMTIVKCSNEKKSLVNNYWVCASDIQRDLLKSEDYNDVRSQWLRTIIHHPGRYVLYKLDSFTSFLFPVEGVSYVWQDGIVPNDIGQKVKYEQLGSIAGMYVNNFGYKHFSFLFEPWLWLAISITFLVYLRKKKQVLSFNGILISSAFLYLLSYLPTGATIDYRFIYWSVLATLIVVLLSFIESHRYHGLINDNVIPEARGGKH